MNAIIAVTEKGGMGYRGKLPRWNIPGDLLRFKQLTENRVIVMGSNTFFSLPESKRPLPKRTNIVITRNPEDTKFDKYRDCPNVHRTTLEQFLVNYKSIFNDIIVIGGPQLITALYPYIFQIDLTIVKGQYECDVFFEQFHKVAEWTILDYKELPDCIRVMFTRTIFY